MEQPPTKINASTADNKALRTKPRLLIFDDFAESLSLFVYAYKQLGFEAIGVHVPGSNDKGKPHSQVAHVVRTPEDLQTLLAELTPDAVLSDFHLGGSHYPHGVCLLDAIKEIMPAIPVAIHTSNPEEVKKVTGDRSYTAMPKGFSWSPELTEKYRGEMADYLKGQLGITTGRTPG